MEVLLYTFIEGEGQREIKLSTAIQFTPTRSSKSVQIKWYLVKADDIAEAFRL